MCARACACVHTHAKVREWKSGQHIGSWCFLGLGYQTRSIMADDKLLYLLNHLANLVLLLNACI